MPNKDLEQNIISLVNDILSAKIQNPQAATTDLENRIDQLVYKLYNMTEDEIEIIENTAK